MSGPITPFTLNVPEADLDDLRSRLAGVRWPEAETGRGLEARGSPEPGAGARGLLAHGL